MRSFPRRLGDCSLPDTVWPAGSRGSWTAYLPSKRAPYHAQWQVLRWQETNIEFGIGEFNVENHPKRVLRELFQVHNADGWSV